MKKFKGYFAIFCAVVLFSLVGYFSLKTPKQQVGQGVENVPYVEETLENYGLLFSFSEGGSVFINLDFYNKKTSFMFFDEEVEGLYMRQFGYRVDNVFKADYVFLAEFIDRFGGITLTGETTMRYTGVQVTDMLSKSLDRKLKHSIAEALISKINTVGFNKRDLIFLIEETETDMSFPTGYGLLEGINKVSNEVYFIN